jgi:apolipoprotein D and lipocalin family protein
MMLNDVSICDSPASLTNFDGARYMGTWYEQIHTKGMPFQDEEGTCTSAHYSDLTSDGHFKVSNTGQDKDFGKRGGVDGDVKCPEADGKCYVAFFHKPFSEQPNYIVIDTDYDNYSMVYSCHSGPTADLWILSRTPVMDLALYNPLIYSAMEKLPQFDFKTLNDHLTVQGDKCTYADYETTFLQ